MTASHSSLDRKSQTVLALFLAPQTRRRGVPTAPGFIEDAQLFGLVMFRLRALGGLRKPFQGLYFQGLLRE